jgi:hypothetical protein
MYTLSEEEIKEQETFKRFDFEKNNELLESQKEHLIKLLEEKFKTKVLKVEQLVFENRNELVVITLSVKLEIPSDVFQFSVDELTLRCSLYYSSQYKFFMGNPNLKYHHVTGGTNGIVLGDPNDHSYLLLIYYPENQTWQLISEKQFLESQK